MAIFPDEMKKPTSFTLESIAGKLKSFSAQLHLLHWQTFSYSEHKAIDDLKSAIDDFTDTVIEELMGYTGKRPKSFKIESPSDSMDSKAVVKEIGQWAYQLYEWAGENDYCDIENKSQELSGSAAKTLYLLTLS